LRTRRTTTLGAVLVALALLAAACGDDDTTPASSGDVRQQTTETSDPDAGNPTDEDSLFPVIVTSNGVDTTIEARPKAIVSLAPTATEMLYAIAAGDQVKAVDDNSNFPPDAPMTDLSAFDPNVESVIAQEPDLVVLSDDVNDVVAGLEAAGIPTIVVPAATTIDDVYTQIEVLGAATGHIGSAAELVATMQADIEELVAQVPEREEPLTYYHELDDQLFSVTSSTFIGEIYALAGLENVADAADPAGEAGGYPQLSAEYLVDADPDLIFLADTKCCGQDADTLAARPGFEQLTAVREGRVVELDDDIASRWGPRIVDFLAAIVNATTTVDAG
jgi:iron complex transport system substrate-binding protein